jgi:hypothetical protein
MQPNVRSPKGSELAVNESTVLFSTEDQLAQSVGEGEWIMDCGHDCCTCDRECDK